ncbi:MAG: SP family arabinose:H+ symporter-like MFS transporter [Bacteroidia bacterium]|jgi:SP family arabinose:H+ symporter-like MFS transporter
MKGKNPIIMMIAMIVALGGLLMGFDASVISGVIKFIEPEFNLSKLQLGWSVASLTVTATLAMLVAGPISDVVGRRTVLRVAAVLYAISAVASALAPNYMFLVIARMLGGFGVGASLILAPMYIAEMAPPAIRGRLVSFNQLNIVIGISLAFFTNYLILQLGKSDASWVANLGIGEHNWRWMLGLEAIPAVLYFFGLFFVPTSPRWLILKGRYEEATKVLSKYVEPSEAETTVQEIKEHIELEKQKDKVPIASLFKPAMRLVLVIGIVVAVLQQITGINSVFFYAPMIFEQSGIGTDASFIQAILVGIINLVFTIIAILLIDKLGRKPLLSIGVAGMTISLFLLAYGFNSATYTIQPASVSGLVEDVDLSGLNSIAGKTYASDVDFNKALQASLPSELVVAHKTEIIKAAIDMNPKLILGGILAFVASFAISLGPVMWVLFSELFPNHIRGIAISFVGFINSGVSFVVQWVFPWQLEAIGNAGTFFIYGVFALIGLIFIIRVIPETKGKSLEELEAQLVK